MIHAYASEPHYARHVTAVWKNLPDDLRGRTFIRKDPVKGMPGKDYLLVGGLIDALHHPENRLIYVEHGAGQSYLGAPSRSAEFYPHRNSVHPPNVVAYISPRQSVASAWGRPAFAAGCPALDDIVGNRSFSRKAVITFHWDAGRVSPEASSAIDHWVKHLPTMFQHLRDAGYEVVGHAHPRYEKLPKLWERLEIPFEADADDVLTTAALLIADNTSLMYEAAALDIPVIALNCPQYRRTVEHGLRFWSAVPGWQVDDIDGFLKIDIEDYVIADPTRDMRHEAAVAAYDDLPDGKSGKRAAEWLAQFVAGK